MNSPARMQIRIIESEHMVELGPLVTVRRSWEARLYDWPWNPWKATEQERRWVPRKDALYDYVNGVFFVHPSLAYRLKAATAEPPPSQWQYNADKKAVRTISQP